MDLDFKVKSNMRKKSKGRIRYKIFAVIFSLVVIPRIISNIPDASSSDEGLEEKNSLLERVVRRAATRPDSIKSPIFLAFVLNNTLPFVFNWICNVKNLISYRNVILVTLTDEDKEEIEQFEPKLNVFSIEKEHDHSGVTENILKLKILAWQLDLIFKMLKRNINILVFRVESVWLRNPMLLFEKILLSDKSLDLITTSFSGNPSALDSGFFYLKSTAESITLISEYIAKIQNLLFRMTDKINRVHAEENPFNYFSQLVYRRSGNVKYNLLPLTHFADVPRYLQLTSGKNGRSRNDLFLIRNYFYQEKNGTSEKVISMKDIAFWFLDERYRCKNEHLPILQDIAPIVTASGFS